MHMAQLMPLPLTISCFSEIQIGFSFLVLAHLGTREIRAVKWVCVCNLRVAKVLSHLALERVEPQLGEQDRDLSRVSSVPVLILHRHVHAVTQPHELRVARRRQCNRHLGDLGRTSGVAQC